MHEVGGLRFTPQTPISIWGGGGRGGGGRVRGLNVISGFSDNFLKTFISLMKHRKCKVCLPFLSHPMPNRCRSNCFTFLTDGYAFIRLVGVEIHCHLFFIYLFFIPQFCSANKNYMIFSDSMQNVSSELNQEHQRYFVLCYV